VSGSEPCAEVQTASALKEQQEQPGVALTPVLQQTSHCLVMTKLLVSAYKQHHSTCG